ncbi:MAG: hypothetical protein GQF41_4489 [Candidatus Rifleibacterium amylolyticum]|nr:MAG: hypothetical protein GQF41_4489 [Candidatus Rifleibacterium amylolyticum]
MQPAFQLAFSALKAKQRRSSFIFSRLDASSSALVTLPESVV